MADLDPDIYDHERREKWIFEYKEQFFDYLEQESQQLSAGRRISDATEVPANIDYIADAADVTHDLPRRGTP